MVLMWNYGHEQSNLITSWVISNNHMISNQSQRWTRHSTLKGLELEDTISLKDAQLTKLMRNYGYELLDSKVYLNTRTHVYESSHSLVYFLKN